MDLHTSPTDTLIARFVVGLAALVNVLILASMPLPGVILLPLTAALACYLWPLLGLDGAPGEGPFDG